MGGQWPTGMVKVMHPQCLPQATDEAVTSIWTTQWASACQVVLGVAAKPGDPRPLLRQGLVPFPFDITPSGYVILPVFPIFLLKVAQPLVFSVPNPSVRRSCFRFVRECEKYDPVVSGFPIERVTGFV